MALTDKLTAIGDGFRSSRGTTNKYSLDEMAVLAAEPIGSGGDAIIKTVSGVCPITLENCAKWNLLDYKIYGAEGGVGNKTKNLCSGVFNTMTKFDEPIPAGTVISFSSGTRGYDASSSNTKLRVRFLDSANNSIWNFYPIPDESGNRLRTDKLTLTQDAYGYWLTNTDVGDYQIEIGSVHTDYEPYGYKIPIKANDATSNIYIKEKLGAADYIDFENRKGVIGGISTMMELPELPLRNGSNTFDVDTEVKPSTVELSYVSKTGAYDAGYSAGYDEMKLAVDMSGATYRFNEEVTSYPSNWYRINLNFTDANGTKYTQMSPYTSSSRINVQYTKAAGGNINAFSASNTPMWADEAYRTIHIIDGPMVGDIKTFIWLFNNGTFNPADCNALESGEEVSSK